MVEKAPVQSQEMTINYNVIYEKKTAHTSDIVGIAVYDQSQNPNLIATSSDDKTIRMWDLRKKSSIRLFRDQNLKDKDMVNLIFGPNNTIITAASKNVFLFDIRQEQIICDSFTNQSNSDNDLINQISIVCDDLGDLTIFDSKTLERTDIFSMQHTNIGFSTDFVYNDNKYNGTMCISSGFDTKMIIWDMNSKAPVRHVFIQEITDKYMPGALVAPPLIYSVTGYQTQILVSVETGQILCFGQKDLKKPKFIIDAHIGKVMRSAFSRFNNQKIVSTSTDLTWAIWNNQKRDEYGVPNFELKIEIPNKPNWMETTIDNKVLIADVSSSLNVYTIKK